MKKYPLLIISFLFFAFSIKTLMATNERISSNNTNNSKGNVAYTQEKNTILLLGDSLSASYGMDVNQGWVVQLNNRLAEKDKPYRLLNASISGETTSGGLARLPAILAENNITDLLIELGGNDGLRGYSHKTIKNNLLKMITLAKEKNIKVYLMQIKIPPNYGPRYNKSFEQVFQEVGDETNTTLLPFFMEKIANDKSLMQKDGIHPNQKAQIIIVDFMEQQLVNMMKLSR